MKIILQRVRIVDDLNVETTASSKDCSNNWHNLAEKSDPKKSTVSREEKKAMKHFLKEF